MTQVKTTTETQNGSLKWKKIKSLKTSYKFQLWYHTKNKEWFVKYTNYSADKTDEKCERVGQGKSYP